MKYEVETTFSFAGSFFVEAENKAEAKAKVLKQCWMGFGREIETTLPDDVCNWTFYPASIKKVGKVWRIE